MDSKQKLTNHNSIENILKFSLQTQGIKKDIDKICFNILLQNEISYDLCFLIDEDETYSSSSSKSISCSLSGIKSKILDTPEKITGIKLTVITPERRCGIIFFILFYLLYSTNVFLEAV